MVMLARLLVDKEDKTALKGHFEELSETTADQPGDLGGPRPEQTDKEKKSADRHSHLRSKSYLCRQSRNGGLQVTNASTSQCQRSASSNIPTESTNVLGTNQSRRTSSDTIGQQPDNVYSDSPLPKTPRRWSPPSPPNTLSLPRPHQSPASPAVPQSLRRPRRPAPPKTRHHSYGTTSDAPSPVTITTSALTSNDVDSVHICLHCDGTFTSHIGLVGHKRIHLTEAGEPVPGASTYTRRICLNCPHCTCTFVHRMGLLGFMRIH
nr:unnamed protein product [Spirometra erinaceieuropaei]